MRLRTLAYCLIVPPILWRVDWGLATYPIRHPRAYRAIQRRLREE